MANGAYSVSDVGDALRSPIPPYSKGGDVRAALAAERPGLLGVLTESELDQWQQAVDRRVAERELAKLVDALVAQGTPALVQQESYKAWRRRAEAALPPPGPAGGVLRIETGRFLDPDIMKIDWDVEAEKAFRLWAIQRLFAGGVTVRLVDPLTEDMRYAQQMLPTDGVITADSLRSIFPDEHRTRVSDRPEIVQLRQLVNELESIRSEIDPEFQNRLQKNEKYSGALAFVRKWSEWLGEGSTDMPDVANWNAPYYLALQPGARLLREGKLELAVPLLRQAYDQMPAVADQFLKYEHRVTSGAQSAVKWLGRIKTVGSIAATLAAGPLGGVWRAAAVTGGYTGAQNLAEQASELGLGQRTSLDLGAAAKDAAMASTMTLIGMPLQAKMQGRILQSLVGREALEQGVTATVLQQRVSSTLAGMVSEVYLVPTQIVMQRVVSGKAWPSSVDELCGMILEQALVSGVLTTATDRVQADLVKLRAERAAAGGGADAPSVDAPAALVPRRSQEIGGHLLAVGEKLAAGGGQSQAPAAGGSTTAGHAGTGQAASYDPVLGPKADPARTPDPAAEFGLSSPDAVKRVAHGVYELSGQPVRKAASDAAQIDIAAEHIMDIIAKELPAGFPRPKIVVGHSPDPDHLGSYNRSKHVIWINADAKATVGRTTEAAFEPMGDGYKRLLGLVYHEARHAEQVYLAMRVRAGALTAQLRAATLAGPHDRHLEHVVRTLHQNHGVNERVARAAAERRISPSDTSPEARLGRDVFEETFATGPRRAQRDFAQSAMGKQHAWQQRLERLSREIDELKKAGKDESEQLRDLVEQAEHTRNDLARAHDIYFKLAEEIDARRAEFSVESAFDRILEAQLHLNMAGVRVKTAEGRLKAVPVEDEDALYQQMKRFFVAALRERDELERLASLLPEPTASTK